MSKTRFLDAAFRVLSDLGDAVITADQDRRVTFCNDVAGVLFGVNPTEILGSDIPSVFNQHDAAADWDAAFAAADRGEPWSGDIPWRGDDGDQTHVALTARPVVLPELAIAGVVFVARVAVGDAADRSLRRALRASEAQHRSTIDALDDGLHVIDRDFQILLFNRGFRTICEKLGVELGEVEGQRLFDVFPFLSQHVADEYTRVFETGETLVTENLMALPSQTVIVETRKIPVFEDQRVTRVITLIRDITERKKTEEELRRLGRAVEQSKDGIVVVDLDDTVLFSNPAWAEMHGYAVHEVLARDLSLFHTPAQFESDVKPLRQALDERGAQTAEIGHRRADGTEFPTLMTASFLRDDEGVAIGVVGVARDITERKRAETELREAKESAEEANRAKGDFLANMSHEIRTPLNGLIGMLRFLQQTRLSNEQGDYVTMAFASAESLLTVINDILDYSRIIEGRLEFAFKPFDVQKAVEDVAYLHYARAEEKGVDVIVDYSAAAPRHVIGDLARFRQILGNLVSNAVKFTEAGYVHIAVRAQEATANETRVTISVTDTGAGIPNHQLDHIFEKFSQIGGDTPRHAGGTGLGLTISKQLVEAGGGGIHVTSELGIGSTFTFTLPFTLDSHGLRADETTGLAGKRVLIACPIEPSCRVLENEIARFGVEVDLAPTAVDAREKFVVSQEKYDAVFVVHAPGMLDGFDLLEEMGSAVRGMGGRIALIASDREREARSKHQPIEADVHLTKPLRQSRIEPVLREFFDAEFNTERREKSEMFGADDQIPAVVLLVEDDHVNQLVAAQLLELLGCTVDVAENGAVALDRLSEKTYDVVFMDARMTVMDGYEATRRFRAEEPEGQHTPVVAMTAHALPGAREKCLAAGMDDYLSKPLDPELLKEALHRWYRPRVG